MYLKFHYSLADEIEERNIMEQNILEKDTHFTSLRKVSKS